MSGGERQGAGRKPSPPELKKILDTLPTGYRQLDVGEKIEAGDFMKIHNAYFSIGTGCACIGDEIHHKDSAHGGHLDIFRMRPSNV